MIPPSAIHPSAQVSPEAVIGSGTSIWQNVQVREDVTIGSNCILGKDSYIDSGVRIGNNVKIQNGVSIYRGVVIEDGVFCGPDCTFTNDRHPRAINPDGTLKDIADWEVTPTTIKYGASLGANCTIVCGVTIGRWALVAAGATVTRDIPDHVMVKGNPARKSGYVCTCGSRLHRVIESANKISGRCSGCSLQVEFLVPGHGQIANS